MNGDGGKCPDCGAQLVASSEAKVVHCPACGYGVPGHSKKKEGTKFPAMKDFQVAMKEALLKYLWTYFWTISGAKHRIFVEYFGEQDMMIYEDTYARHSDYREAIHKSFAAQLVIIDAEWLLPLPEVMPGMRAFGVVNCRDYTLESATCPTCGWGQDLETRSGEPLDCYKPIR